MRLGNFKVRLGHLYAMFWKQRTGLIGITITLIFVSALLLVRLSAFGIWDPWELNIADTAQKIALGKGLEGHHGLNVWLVAFGFKTFEIHEWAGRFPIAIFGIATVFLAYALVKWFAEERTAVYAAAITATCPLFLLNARPMLGETVAFTFQALIALSASAAVFKPKRNGERTVASTVVWLVVLLISTVLAIQTRGALLCALPPLAAVACVIVFEGLLLRLKKERLQSLAGYLVVTITLFLATMITVDIAANQFEFSRWIGGVPKIVNPPTYEVVLEVVFHSFAPWAAVLPVALVGMLAPPNKQGEVTKEQRDDRQLRLVLFLWLFFGYGAQTLLISRYDAAVSYLPIVALGAVVAIFLCDIERSQEGYWGYAVIATFFTVLIIRDYSLFPESPVKGMPIADFKVPEVLDFRKEWAAVILPTALFLIIGLAVSPDEKRPDIRKPYRLIKEQWDRGLGYKLWLIAIGLLVVVLVIVGIFAYVSPKTIRLTTLATKVYRRLIFLPIALPLLVMALQYLPWIYSKIKGKRLAPAIFASAIFAIATTHDFLPKLSEHFSPREVFETYNKLGSDSHELAEFQIGARAAAYYAHGKVRAIERQSELVDYLVSSQRRWAVFPADDLASINRSFRRRIGDHLFIADARNARVLLATNSAVKGQENHNLLAKYVLKRPPRVENPVRARFSDKLEFLGYNLDLPRQGYVGAGESFKISWVFRVLKNITGNYKLFVHIDGLGQRINGDHDPLDGKYPVRLWEKNDVVVDVQELEVPSHFQRGDYKIYMGLFSGDTRMPVEEGPEDNSNRVIAGTLQIR